VRRNRSDPDPPRPQVVKASALAVGGNRQHSELRVAKQQRHIKVALAFRVMADHHDIGMRTLDGSREPAGINFVDNRHVGLRCYDVVDDVKHQWRHSRQKDTNPLQGIAFRVRDYGTERAAATEPLDPMKI